MTSRSYYDDRSKFIEELEQEARETDERIAAWHKLAEEKTAFFDGRILEERDAQIVRNYKYAKEFVKNRSLNSPWPEAQLEGLIQHHKLKTTDSYKELVELGMATGPIGDRDHITKSSNIYNWFHSVEVAGESDLEKDLLIFRAPADKWSELGDPEELRVSVGTLKEEENAEGARERKKQAVLLGIAAFLAKFAGKLPEEYKAAFTDGLYAKAHDILLWRAAEQAYLQMHPLPAD